MLLRQLTQMQRKVVNARSMMLLTNRTSPYQMFHFTQVPHYNFSSIENKV
jgi:hypothetical protein